VLTQQQATAWLAQQEQAGRDGVFFIAATSFLVSARRP
jgi:hypothetical protein